MITTGRSERTEPPVLRVKTVMEAGWTSMSGLKTSLASWRAAHGFGILCIRSPLGERFVFVPSEDSLSVLQSSSTLTDLSESAFRSRLRQANLSDVEIDEAIELAREWATTFEGSGNVFWDVQNSSHRDRPRGA
jgi:hypothetical protein